MILGTYQDIQHLNPLGGGLRNNKNAWDGFYNTLTQWATDGSGLPEAQLAQSWETTSDGLTWTFTIADNVVYHDGRQMTADDVKFSFDKLFDTPTAAGTARQVSQIERTEVVDDTTFQFHLSSPNGALLTGLIDARILDKDLFAAGDENKAALGTGPFNFVEYVVHDRVVMDKNENYWETGIDGQALPYMDGVTILTLPDPTALFTALLTGLVDTYWQMTPKFMVQLDALTDASAFAEDSVWKTAFNNFFWEWDRGIFQDVRARRAVLLSIDREKAAFAGYEGLAAANPTNSFFPIGGPFTNPNLKAIERDVPAATALWKELFEEYGEVDITFLYTAISAEFRPMSLVHEANMKEVGVENISIELVSIQHALDRLAYQGRAPEWQTEHMMFPNISFRNTEPSGTLASWQCGGHWSSHYCDEELDTYIKQGLESTDFLKRQEAYYNYQVRAQEVIPSFVCCWRSVGHGRSERLQNLRSNFGDFYYTRSWLDQQ